MKHYRDFELWANVETLVAEPGDREEWWSA